METIQVVTMEYLERDFHGLYFDLIVCDKEQHKPALCQLESWNFSYQTPLVFWSVIFFNSRGDHNIANDNTFTWKETLVRATQGLECHKDSSWEEEQLE